VSHEPLGEFGEASDGSIKKVASAWTVQVTPTGRAGDAVTFRVQWTRSRENGKPSAVGDDVQLTLRPGQSLSLDIMRQSADAPTTPSFCAMYLSVGVIHWPEPDRDRRLVGVDLWLVERLPDGKERSQSLPLRGLYNQPIPFYFDTLTEGTKTLDVFGELQIAPGGRPSELRITTRSRVVDLKPPPPPLKYPPGMPWPLPPYIGSTTATLQVAPDEVVSVMLPPVGNGTTDAAIFAARALSFRIRVRPIR
jgi:hypothetical protein